MIHTHILDLRSAESRSQLRCGHKGAKLAALSYEAVPVPEGFVVTADAFSSFLATPVLSSIHAKLQTADDRRSIALAEAMRHQILTTRLPRSLQEELSRKLPEYQNRSAGLWAVRASPAAESHDLTCAAPRYYTLLGVRTGEVPAATRQVWSSAFSERAVQGPRERKSAELRMAVIVQKLLNPEVSGICCGTDPMRRKDRIVVYASYGLGKVLARGTATPDTHVVDRQSLEPVMDILGSKRVQVVARAGGLAETRVPRDKRRRFCLSPSEVSGIAKLAKAVEARRGKPADIEWAYEGGTLYLLEVRDPVL